MGESGLFEVVHPGAFYRFDHTQEVYVIIFYATLGNYQPIFFGYPKIIRSRETILFFLPGRSIKRGQEQIPNQFPID